MLRILQREARCLMKSPKVAFKTQEKENKFQERLEKENERYTVAEYEKGVEIEKGIGGVQQMGMPPTWAEQKGMFSNYNPRFDFPQGLSEEEKSKLKRFDIFRHDRNDMNGRPHFVSYYIDPNECGNMYLDALIKIKDEIDPTLSFRRSCREGICGSCAMSIDGRHHLACICSFPNNTLTSQIGPLTFMHLIKDLVGDMTNFYSQYKQLDPWLKRKSTKAEGEKEYLQSQNERALLDGLYECVLCLCCSSSCPSYWWHTTEYLGPSVLQQAFRWVIDSRDEYTDERLEKYGGDMKMGECFQIGLCTLNCPKQLNPQGHIKELQQMYEHYKERKSIKQVTIDF